MSTSFALFLITCNTQIFVMITLIILIKYLISPYLVAGCFPKHSFSTNSDAD